MTLLSWLILGLISGFIASHLVNHRGEGMVLDILLGIVGAVIGGWIAPRLGVETVNGVNLASIISSVCGAILFLFVYHLIRRGVIGRRVF